MKLDYTHEQRLEHRVFHLESDLRRNKEYMQRKFIGPRRRERLARKIARQREQLAAVKMELTLIK